MLNFLLLMYVKKRLLVAILVIFLMVQLVFFLNNHFYDEVTALSSSAFKVFALINYFDFQGILKAFRTVDNKLIWSAVDISTGQRLFELLTVIDELRDGGNLIFGEGLGGAANLSETKDLSIVTRRANGDVSNVRVFHLMITWILNKMGILGLFFFFTYLWSVFQRTGCKLRDRKRILYYSVCIAFFFKSFVTFGAFLVHYYFPILFGYFAFLNHIAPAKHSK